MGAAIACFADAQAVDVPRSRFAPVKTTGDLLTLRSDAYEFTENGCAMLVPERHGVPPHLHLDGNFKLVDQLEAALAGGVPSLRACGNLRVDGPVVFSADVRFEGDVSIANHTGTPLEIPAGTYRDQEIELTA